MKICPRCHSSYSDETLNFCLTDGIPLVAGTAINGVTGTGASISGVSQHSSWQEAETLHDGNFVLPFSGGATGASTGEGHTTSPNSGAPTFASSSSHTAASIVNVAAPPSPKKSSNLVLFSIVGTLLVLGIASGVFWYFAGGANAPATSQNAIPAATIEVKKTSVALPPEQENQIKKEISEMLETWRASIEKHDIDTHIKSYVAQLDNYYKESGIHREHVRADRLRAFERYPNISLQVDNIKITPHSLEAATVVFDKSWTFKRPERTSTGSVQQEMELVKQNGRWLINGEKDAKVYYINNRDNAPNDAAAVNANQTANTNASSR